MSPRIAIVTALGALVAGLALAAYAVSDLGEIGTEDSSTAALPQGASRWT